MSRSTDGVITELLVGLVSTCYYSASEYLYEYK